MHSCLSGLLFPLATSAFFCPGLLRYYKKEVPENETKEQPQGEINVTRDCVGLLTHEQVCWPCCVGSLTSLFYLLLSLISPFIIPADRGAGCQVAAGHTAQLWWVFASLPTGTFARPGPCGSLVALARCPSLLRFWH